MKTDQMSASFYDFCSTVSTTLSSFGEVVAYVAQVNYQLVSDVCHYVTLIATTVFWILETVFHASLEGFIHISDFSSDLFGCFCTLCHLVWKVVLLVYKVVCLGLTGFETLAICIWKGSCVAVVTLHKSAVDVMDTCGFTWSYGMDLSKSFVDTVAGGFAMLGGMAVSIVKGVFSGLGYGFASLLVSSWKCGTGLLMLWENLTSKLVDMFTFSKEAYLGILLCGIVYISISGLIRFFNNERFSIWRWWQRWSRRPQYRPNMYEIDTDFESDVEEQDYEHFESEVEDQTSDDTITGDSDLDQSDDLDGESDDESDDDDSDGSLNSQAFSSDDSDHEIEVQLPAPTERYNLRSRSSTPCWAQKTDMTSSDFEVEIEREKDKRKCVVCQDQSKSVLILPCRHMCLCVDCADRIVKSRLLERRICPLCRQRIQKVMNVYV